MLEAGGLPVEYHESDAAHHIDPAHVPAAVEWLAADAAPRGLQHSPADTCRDDPRHRAIAAEPCSRAVRMTGPMHPVADTRLRAIAGPSVLAGAPDERLVALARAGDERAFDEIVERYRAPLLRYVRGYLPPAAAEDALQQAFINAYAALTSETAKVPVSLRPWMYRVAHNAALNARRDPHAGVRAAAGQP